MTDSTVTFTLTMTEALDIIKVIGNLPTKTNAFPLYTKLVGQVQPRLIPEVPNADTQ